MRAALAILVLALLAACGGGGDDPEEQRERDGVQPVACEASGACA